MKKYFLRYLWGMFCMIIYTCSTLILPNLVSLIIDKGINVGSITQVVRYALSLLILGCILMLFQYLLKVNFAKLSQDIIIDIQKSLMDKVTRANYSFWNSHRPGDVYSVIEKDVSKLESLLSSITSDALISVFVATGVAIYLFYIDRLIGIIIVILAITFAFLQRRAGQRVKSGMTALRNTAGEISSLSNNIINNALPIRMMGLVPKVNNEYIKGITNYKDQYIKQVKLMNIVQITAIAFNSIGLFIIMVLGAIKILNHDLTVGVLFSLTLYLQKLYNPIVNLGNIYMSIKSIIPILNKILDISENKNEVVSGTYTSLTPLKGKVFFENVNFSYTDNVFPVFENLNLTLLPGETIGIVGKNGTGKTTLIRLLARLCMPSSGAIYLDNVEINSYTDTYLWNSIGIMTQDNYLPRWKIREVFECDEDQEDRIYYLMDYLNFPVQKLENGLESVIGDNKISLSGGEAQKIAFIRLILQNKQIYIMDEPTAALDTESEDKMVNLIRDVLKDKTCLIITHRPKVLEICDRTIELSCDF